MVLALAAPAAWAVVYDPATAPAPGSEPAAAASANPQAQAALESGLAALKEAEVLDASAPAATGGPKKLPPALKDAYTRARSQFQDATQRDATIAEAWNGLGYSQRKLGDYNKALASYARALSLRPGYPEATEYRGEAYLGLNRIDDAKRAYLDLFATNRSLAERLLGAMKHWVDGNGGAENSPAADLAKWIEERSQIAAQTASLTREGTSAGWR
jgi:tetratricopeptide (TPR) repeat protein